MPAPANEATPTDTHNTTPFIYGSVAGIVALVSLGFVAYQIKTKSRLQDKLIPRLHVMDSIKVVQVETAEYKPRPSRIRQDQQHPL
ncbi:hypothetical protein HDU98_006982, partial [Podochytrium sp. JEL0797]